MLDPATFSRLLEMDLPGRAQRDIPGAELLLMNARGKELTPEEEGTIATSPEMSYRYAVINDRPFPRGEATLASDAEYAFKYAKYILKHRFPAGEAAIVSDPRRSYLYRFFLRGAGLKWADGEYCKAYPEALSHTYQNCR